MPSLYRLALLALPLVSRVACDEQPAATPTKAAGPIYANAHEAFQDLINALPEESLHAALHGLARFQEGVFESDRHGVERVHKDNPPLATKLIVAAVQDLKKRQTPSNGTVPSNPSTSVPEQPSSQAPPASSEGPPAVIPVPITQTDSNGQTAVITSAILSEPTASVAVEITRTNAQGQTEVATETKPAVIFRTTDSAGQSIVATSAVDLAPTPGQVLTTTDAKGSTFLTTYTPGGGKVSSIKLITTTGPDGKPSVVTSYAFVDPAATPTGGSPPSGTQAGKPGLQSGAAHKNKAMDAAVFGGAIGGVFALLI